MTLTLLAISPGRLTIADFLRTDACAWASCRFKDGRRGFMWLCHACGSRGFGRKQPECPARAILRKVGPR
jgi:hypothetical protein